MAQLETLLSLSHSLRESVVAIDVLVVGRDGIFFSADDSAVRLWSPKRQLKSVHFGSESSTKRLRIICAVYLETINSFLVVYGFRRPIIDDDEEEDPNAAKKGGMMQVWSSSLILLQEISLDYLPLRFCSFSPCKGQLVLVEETARSSVVIQVETKEDKRSNEPSYSQLRETEKAKRAFRKIPLSTGSAEVGTSTGGGTSSVYLFQMQQVTHSDIVLDTTFLEKNLLAFLMRDTIVVMTKRGENNYEPTQKNLTRKRVNHVSDEHDLFATSYRFGLLCSSMPCALCNLDRELFAVGFSDGSIQVVRCQKDFGDARILARIQAHKSGVPGLISSRISIENCRWSTRSPGGGYDFEFVSKGSDRKIMIWGMRSLHVTQQQQSLVEAEGESFRRGSASVGAEEEHDLFPKESSETAINKASGFVLDLLGQYDIPVNPPSSVVGEQFSKLQMKIGKILSCEFGNEGGSGPCRRQLVIPIGGMICFFEAHQPYRPIYRHQGSGKITLSGRGPLASLWREEDQQQGFFKEHQFSSPIDVEDAEYDTFYVLHDSVVSFVDPLSGDVIRQVETLYIEEAVDPVATFGRVTSSSADKFSRIGKDNAFNAAIRAHEGTTTSAYWCPFTLNLIIGFSTGGIALINYNSLSTKKKQVYLDTASVHDSDITQMLSFLQPFGGSGHQQAQNAFLLVGDSKGILSVWRMTPTNETATLTWSAQAHQGPLIFARDFGGISSTSSSEDKNAVSMGKVFVTACSAGIVKAWVQHSKGEFMLASFFNTSDASTGTMTMRSFSAVFVVSIEEAKEVVHRSNKTFQESFFDSLRSESIHSAKEKAQALSVGRSSLVRILCICGLSTGTVEGWLLSTSNDEILSTLVVTQLPMSQPSPKPIWRDTSHNMPVNCIQEIKDSGCTSELSGRSSYNFLCFSESGSVSILQVKSTGEFGASVGYFTLPFPCKQVIPTTSEGKLSGEFLIVGESDIVEVSPALSSLISSRWHYYLGSRESEEDRLLSQKGRTQEQDDIGGNNDDDDQGGIERDVASTASSTHDNSLADLKKYQGLGEDAAFSSKSEDMIAGTLDDSDGNSIYAEPMQAMQRAVTAELYFAKKDRRLIELFRQSEDSNSGEVSSAQAVEIVHRWLKSEVIEKSRIMDLMLHLGINMKENLNFIQVAKIVAVAQGATKKLKAESFASMTRVSSWSDYRHLKSTRKIVTFNSFGEKVVNEIELTQVVTDGLQTMSSDELREIWRRQPSRVIEALKTPVVKIPTLLQQVPKQFKRIIMKDMELPSKLHVPEAFKSCYHAQP